MKDVSKVFDCLPHNLIIAKRNAYRFSFSWTRLIHSYLSGKKQRTKINSAYSSWEEIFFGLLQSSILGQILFNIFICDLFSIVNIIDFASYAGDNTPYVIGENTKEVIAALENSSKELIQWLSNNQMKVNDNKYHLLTCANEESIICIDKW